MRKKTGRELSMNRTFGPALAGPDRLKAGLQTSGVPMAPDHAKRSRPQLKRHWCVSVKLAVHLNLHLRLTFDCHRSHGEVADLGMSRVITREHFGKPANGLQAAQILDHVHVQLPVVTRAIGDDVV